MGTEYKLGARPSPEDVRDYSVRLVAQATLPTNFSLALGKNYNQKVNNCFWQSARGLFRHKYGIEFGVDMGYGGARSGDYYGTYPNDGANFIVKYGIAPLKDDPGEQEVAQVITYYNANKTQLEKAAAPYKAKAWGRPLTISEVKASIYSGMPVQVMMPWYAWNTDNLYRLAKTGTFLGFHEVLIIGWQVVAGIEMAIIYNSHGENFGNKGEGYAYWDHVFETTDLIGYTLVEVVPNNTDIVTVYPTLRKGMSGEYVRLCQTLLTKKGFGSIVGTADGSFGTKTESAVIAFQKKMWPTKEKEWDGIVGRKTWDALEEDDIPPTPSPTPKTDHDTLRLKDPYMKGAEVELCQQLLKNHGISCGIIDSVFGKQTKEAVVAFQTAKKLSVDGVVGSKTWTALEAAPVPTPTPKTKIDRFIAYLKGELGNIYVWGAQGENLTDMLNENGKKLSDKTAEAWIKRVETSTANADRAIVLYKKRVTEGKKLIKAYDCSGLLVRFLLDNELIKSDLSSRGLFSACKELKTRAELMPGDFVFRHNGVKIHHVGVYIGDGQVIEAMGRDVGVVQRDINNSGGDYWNRCGRLQALQG